MLAVAVTKLPEGAAWAYELKFDGDSALGVKAAQKSTWAGAVARNRPNFERGPSSPGPVFSG
jgi:hypothetical protein